MKLHLPRRRWIRALIYCFAVLLVLVAVDLLLVRIGRRITISPETTKITSPIQADGRPDYLAALDSIYGQGVTPENNAAPQIVSILGPDVFRGEYGAAQRKWLNVPNGPTLVDYEVYLNPTGSRDTAPTEQQTEEYEKLQTTPWTAADHPAVAKWMDQQNAAIDVLVKATDKPRFFIPFNMEPKPQMVVEVLLLHLAPCRAASHALAARASLRMGSGDFERGRRDLLAGLRLGRLLAQRGTLVEKLVGYAIETQSLAAVRGAALSGKLTPAQLATLQGEIEAFPPCPSLVDAIDYAERYMILDCAITIAGGTRDIMNISVSNDMPALHLFNVIPVNLDGLLRESNSFYDRFIAALAGPDYPSRRKALDQLMAEYLKVRQSSNILRPDRALLSQLVPALGKVEDAHTRILAQHNLTIATLALARFHAKSGQWPASLAELTPEFLAAPTADPFTVTALLYHPEGKVFVIYSINSNQKDDGGHNDKEPGYKGTDDVIVRFPPGS